MSILKKPDPLRELLAIQQQINKLFEDRLKGASSDPESADPAARSAWVPAVDLYETDEEFTIHAEVAGLLEGEVSVEVAEGGTTVTLRGERRGKAATGSGAKPRPARSAGSGKQVPAETFHRMEREYGTFVRSFTLPHPVLTLPVEAVFRDGVLQVRLRKGRPKSPG